MDNYNYPIGADNCLAPWNDVDDKREIEVTISLTISKSVKILVDDYIAEEEDGHMYYDYSNCNLYKAVQEQITLPNDLSRFTERMFDYDLNLKAAGMPISLKEAIKDCKGWDVDDLEIIRE